LEEPFRRKPHLEDLLKGRRWGRVKARIKKMGRTKVIKDRIISVE
jgi:hypothetical protein